MSLDPSPYHVGSARQDEGDASLPDDLTTGGDITFGGTLLSARQQTETVAANKTLDEGDNGVIQMVTVDAVVITLPATVVGYQYTIVNAAPDGTALVSISPAATDKIMGNGFTSADDKDARNTKATAKRGDMMRLVGDGVNGWMVAEVRGTWARE